ncbi:MAG TPA: GGDEF domain-containing protein, partial [Tepidisphaeraceae bacterium]|nr:GGDEF domain-containing protein [Tepidisphaeraceae bacterium]
ESLSRVGSLAEPLAIACTDMARELRMERARTQQLQEEVRLKVAGRTEALERTIGALRQQAARDGLTGLFNRRMLDAYLPEAIERCRSAKLPLAVLMIDVDNFKPLNDTLGHAAGDQMLKSIAQIIRSTISETDLAFRNGGDEFVIVFEGCAAETARLKQERLNSLGKALGRTFRLTPPPTLSIGMTMLADLKDATAPALLRQADQSLYTVKAEHHTAAPVAPPTRRSA